MSDNTATIVGNLTRTPVLRYTANSIPVTDLTVAVNHRRKDPMTEQWHDVACTYYTVTCWRTLAEHAVRTFEKGHRVIVIGRMYVEEWTGREGDVRQSIRIEPSQRRTRHPFLPGGRRAPSVGVTGPVGAAGPGHRRRRHSVGRPARRGAGSRRVRRRPGRGRERGARRAREAGDRTGLERLSGPDLPSHRGGSDLHDAERA